LPKSPGSIADRLKLLIARVFDGSVNAAAAYIGMKQTTLAKIVSGEIKSPRAATLQLIAVVFDADLNWLVSGVGELPPVLQTEPAEGATAEMLRWESIVLRLARHNPELLAALISLPMTVRMALKTIEQPRTPRAGKISGAPATNEAARKAEGLEYRAWITLFEALLKQYGAERLRQILLENFPVIKAGFREASPARSRKKKG
jgi:transcriptional regulator with XRE-family HTH domain